MLYLDVGEILIDLFCFSPLKNFAAQMAGGFDEKAGGGAQMGVMQGPMVSKCSGPYFITELKCFTVIHVN